MSSKPHFDEFLKKGAGQFEIKPQHGTFQKIRRRTQIKSTLRFVLPLAFLGMMLTGLGIGYQAEPDKELLLSDGISENMNGGGTCVSQIVIPSKNTPLIKKPVRRKSNNISAAAFIPLVKKPKAPEFLRTSEAIVALNAVPQIEWQIPLNQLASKGPIPIRPILEKKRRVLWQFYAGTGMAFRYLKYRAGNSYNPHSFNNADGFDWKQHRSIQGYVAGISAEMMAGKYMYIKSGFQFFAGGYDIQNKFTNYQPAGLSTIPYEEHIRSQYRIMFGEIPLVAGYKIYQPNLTWRLEGGLNISTKLYQSIPEAAGLLGREYSVWNGTPRSLGITAQLAPGIEIKFASQRIVAGLDLRYQLTSTYISTYPVKEHLYFAGWRTGIVF